MFKCVVMSFLLCKGIETGRGKTLFKAFRTGATYILHQQENIYKMGMPQIQLGSQTRASVISVHLNALVSCIVHNPPTHPPLVHPFSTGLFVLS